MLVVYVLYILKTPQERKRSAEDRLSVEPQQRLLFVLCLPSLFFPVEERAEGCRKVPTAVVAVHALARGKKDAFF